MKKIINTTGLTVAGMSLTSLGSKSTLPLGVRITAQIELSRNNVDLTLAQKATDLAVKEGGEDISKYILVVLSNEIQIITETFKKKTDLSDSEEKSNAAFKNFQRLKKLIVKYHELYADIFVGPSKNIFEEMLGELLCQYLELDLNLSYDVKDSDEPRVASILPLRKLISIDSVVLRIDTAIWNYHFECAYSRLVTSVFWEIISYRFNYNGPIEPEQDPKLIFPDRITSLVTNFICNPDYTNEALNKKARKSVWALSCMYSAINMFNEQYDDYEWDQIGGSETKVVKELTVIFKKLVVGKVEEKVLIPAIKKIVKDHLLKE